MRQSLLFKSLLLCHLMLASCIAVPDNKDAIAPTEAAPIASNETLSTEAETILASAADPAEGKLVVIGETEYLYISEAEYAYDARIDTGATTSSIHAEDIVSVERDGEQWVNFNLVNFDTKERIECSEKVVRIVEIKQHASDSVKRFVVQLHVQVAGEPNVFEFSLADRSHYSYPMLVGRNMLRGIAVVDVSRSYTLEKVTKASLANSQSK